MFYIEKNEDRFNVNYPDPSIVKELFNYDAATGNLTWSHSNRWHAAGSTAGYSTNGYRMVRIKGCPSAIGVHRIAWAFIFNEWPMLSIDHINGNRSDNRIENLRLATFSENLRNTSVRKNNKSGFKGVFKVKGGGYIARLSLEKKQYYGGHFKTAELASEAYEKLAKILHGEFYRPSQSVCRAL